MMKLLYTKAKSIKEEDTFKAIPYTGFVFSIITTLVWALVYGVGFLL